MISQICLLFWHSTLVLCDHVMVSRCWITLIVKLMDSSSVFIQDISLCTSFVCSSHVVRLWRCQGQHEFTMDVCSSVMLLLHLVKITAGDGPNKCASATECKNSIVVTCFSFFFFRSQAVFMLIKNLHLSSLPCFPSLCLSVCLSPLFFSVFPVLALKAGLFHVT